VTPLTPDTTRVFSHSIVKTPMPALVRRLSRLALPRWVQHLVISEVRAFMRIHLPQWRFHVCCLGLSVREVKHCSEAPGCHVRGGGVHASRTRKAMSMERPPRI